MDPVLLRVVEGMGVRVRSLPPFSKASSASLRVSSESSFISGLGDGVAGGL